MTTLDIRLSKRLLILWTLNHLRGCLHDQAMDPQNQNIMSQLSLEPFALIGVTVRTSNAAGEAVTAIPQLWNRFMAEGMAEKIPNKLEEALYCVYTDYEGDHSQPYSVILGCRVAHTDEVPEGMVAKTMPGGKYVKRVAKGNLNEGAVFKAWNKIWQEGFPRAYTADYEVYGGKAQNPLDAEVDIYLAV